MKKTLIISAILIVVAIIIGIVIYNKKKKQASPSVSAPEVSKNSQNEKKEETPEQKKERIQKDIASIEKSKQTSAITQSPTSAGVNKSVTAPTSAKVVAFNPAMEGAGSIKFADGDYQNCCI